MSSMSNMSNMSSMNNVSFAQDVVMGGEDDKKQNEVKIRALRDAYGSIFSFIKYFLTQVVGGQFVNLPEPSDLGTRKFCDFYRFQAVNWRPEDKEVYFKISRHSILDHAAPAVREDADFLGEIKLQNLTLDTALRIVAILPAVEAEISRLERETFVFEGQNLLTPSLAQPVPVVPPMPQALEQFLPPNLPPNPYVAMMTPPAPPVLVQDPPVVPVTPPVTCKWWAGKPVGPDPLAEIDLRRNSRVGRENIYLRTLLPPGGPIPAYGDQRQWLARQQWVTRHGVPDIGPVDLKVIPYIAGSCDGWKVTAKRGGAGSLRKQRPSSGLTQP